MTRFALIAGGLVAGLLSISAAQAQEGLSPQAKQALAQACRNDFASYCAGVTPGDGGMKGCVRDNFRSFSAPCKDVLKQIMAQRQ
jgi:hypothetical protein